MRRADIPVVVLLGLAGFAGNWFKFELFFNIDILFGSCFTMLALLRLSPQAGAAAAALAGAATYFLWGHPYAWFILVAEAAAVGYLTSRRSMDLLVADIAFWLVGGSLLVWLSYHHLLRVGAEPTLMIMLKQGVNGVCNALVAYSASTVYDANRAGSPNRLPSFRQVLFVAMASLVLFPAMVFLSIDLRAEMRSGLAKLTETAAQTAVEEAALIGRWITERHRNVITLANLVAQLSPGDTRAMQREIEIVKSASPSFKRMGVLDAEGVIVAYSPLADETGKPAIGRDFSDRPFIPIIKATKKPYISDVVIGRIGEPAPMIPMLAPVVRGGEYDGYCTGIVDTAMLSDLMSVIARNRGGEVTLLDRSGKVVAATAPGVAMMDEYRNPEQAESHDLGRGVSHIVPRPGPGKSRMERWRDSFASAKAACGPDNAFVIVADIPLRPLLDRLTVHTITALTAMSVLVLLAAAFSWVLSDWLTRPLKRLWQAAEAIPRRFAAGEEEHGPDAKGASGVLELDALFANFRRMSLMLGGFFNSLKKLNQTLEERVLKRTRELEESRENLRAVVEAAPAAMVVFDGRENIVAVNRRYAALTGYEAEELKDFGVLMEKYVSDPELRETLGRGWREAVASARNGGPPVGPFEGEIVCKDGSAKFVEAQTAIAGEMTITTLTDLTDREARRLEMQTAVETAQSGAREKSAFLASMSHELRTPLGGIMGMLQLCQMENLSPTQREYIDISLDAARRLLTLLNDILDLSRIEAGKMTLRQAPFNPAKLAESMAALFKEQSMRKQVPLVLSMDARLPDMVVGDESRLRQVLFNLIGNAFKFTDKGRVSVTLEPVGVIPGRSRFKLLCQIADTGCGIEEDMLDELFTPFTRAEAGYAGARAGTGLGLSIVKRLVGMMGGEVCLESRPGQGTQVCFTVEVQGAPEAAAEDGDPPPAGLACTPGGHLRVLIAEDEALNARFLQLFLDGQGVATEVAPEGGAVLAMLRRQPFDLILMDVQMPGLDGLAATRAIRASGAPYADIPIVALTAHAMAGDRETFLAAGMDDYVSKPVETDQLMEVILRALRGKRADAGMAQPRDAREVR